MKLLKKYSVLLILFSVCYNNINAQELDKKIVSRMEDDEEGNEIFEITKAPEKWKEESAVILAFKIKQYHNRVKKNIEAYNYLRYRVLIKDKFSLRSFSEVEIPGNDHCAITIVKPNGDKEEVDLDQAVSQKTGVENFLGFTGLSFDVSSKKLAIPNLEIGDIIDITFVSGSTDLAYDQITEMENQLSSFELKGKYPLYKCEVEFKFSDEFLLNFKALNGAANVEKVKEKNEFTTYLYSDSLFDRYKAEYWTSSISFNPCIKYQVIYKTKSIKKFYKTATLNSEYNESYLKNTAAFLTKDRAYSHSDFYINFLKATRSVDTKDPEQYAYEVYYFMRAWYNTYSVNRISNQEFIRVFRRLMDKRGIKYDYIAGVPRSRGGLDALMSDGDLIWCIQLRTENKPVFYNIFRYASPGALPSQLQGIEVYYITPAGAVSKVKTTKETVTPDDPEVNTVTYDYKGTIDISNGNITFERTVKAKGLSKDIYASMFNWLVFEKDIEKYDWKDNRYNTWWAYSGLVNTSQVEEEKERMNNYILEFDQKAKEEFMKEDLQSDGFSVKEYLDFKLSNDGRYADDPVISFSDKFILEDLFKKSGSNYLLDLGYLAGQQLELKDAEDQERVSDIFYSYPRKIKYNIELTMPDGWTIKGYEDAVKSVDNSTGAFTSKINVDGNKITITTEKVYKDVKHPKEDYAKILAFINASTEFRNTKAILVKK